MTTSTEAITEALQAAQKPLTHHLWTPSDAITFTPQVLQQVFGDGRALFAFGTLNSRPAYWITRVDSCWTSGLDYGRDPAADAEDFAERSEDVLTALEEEFGRAECGYEYGYNRDGQPYCRETGRFLSWSEISYPIVNAGGGWHWGRLDWPELPGLSFVPHPLHPAVRLLAPEHTHVETAQATTPPIDIATPNNL